MEGINSLKEITPRVVSRFIAHERNRGTKTNKTIGFVRTFFAWLQAEEYTDQINPVIPGRHSQGESSANVQPYTDADLRLIWSVVENSDNVGLKLAFSIGRECGLRVGEVANIRLSDIDQDKQTIHVRLPTKNMRARDVRYHNDVAKYLELWLKLRNPNCEHDHLLHGKRLGKYTNSSLDTAFHKLFSNHPSSAPAFRFHRLRHTWATRLMNNGMELAVLKELGGWVSWSSMQIYIKVLPETIQRQYQETYSRIQEANETGAEESFSLIDFALMNSLAHATHAE